MRKPTFPGLPPPFVADSLNDKCDVFPFGLLLAYLFSGGAPRAMNPQQVPCLSQRLRTTAVCKDLRKAQYDMRVLESDSVKYSCVLSSIPVPLYMLGLVVFTAVCY